MMCHLLGRTGRSLHSIHLRRQGLVEDIYLAGSTFVPERKGCLIR